MHPFLSTELYSILFWLIFCSIYSAVIFSAVRCVHRAVYKNVTLCDGVAVVQGYLRHKRQLISTRVSLLAANIARDQSMVVKRKTTLGSRSLVKNLSVNRSRSFVVVRCRILCWDSTQIPLHLHHEYLRKMRRPESLVIHQADNSTLVSTGGVYRIKITKSVKKVNTKHKLVCPQKSVYGWWVLQDASRICNISVNF